MFYRYAARWSLLVAAIGATLTAVLAVGAVYGLALHTAARTSGLLTVAGAGGWIASIGLIPPPVGTGPCRRTTSRITIVPSTSEHSTAA